MAWRRFQFCIEILMPRARWQSGVQPHNIFGLRQKTMLLIPNHQGYVSGLAAPVHLDLWGRIWAGVKRMSHARISGE
jgi:hypothetical protein